MRGRRPRSRGFTLIELVAVVTIIAILLGLAATRIDFLIPKYRLRGAARELASVMKLAQARAAATGKEVYLEMDLSSGRYWLLVAFPTGDLAARDSGVVPPVPGILPTDLPTAFEAAPLVKAWEYQPLFDSTLPEGVKFWTVLFGPKEAVDRGTARMKFAPFGMSSHTIVNLRNDEDRHAAVQFNGFTGYVSFHEEWKEAEALLEDSGP